MIKAAITTVLNSSTYTAIATGIDSAFGFGVYAVDDTGEMVPFYYAVDATGTGAALASSMGITWGHYVRHSTVALYAKALSGTPSMVLVPARKVQ